MGCASGRSGRGAQIIGRSCRPRTPASLHAFPSCVGQLSDNALGPYEVGPPSRHSSHHLIEEFGTSHAFSSPRRRTCEAGVTPRLVEAGKCRKPHMKLVERSCIEFSGAGSSRAWRAARVRGRFSRPPAVGGATRASSTVPLHHANSRRERPNEGASI
jgi:hypothetical protein